MCNLPKASGSVHQRHIKEKKKIKAEEWKERKEGREEKWKGKTRQGPALRRAVTVLTHLEPPLSLLRPLTAHVKVCACVIFH